MAEDDFSDRLCGALMGIFGAGADGLPEIVDGLNRGDVDPPDGNNWTEDGLRATFAGLADTLAKAECSTKIEIRRTVAALPVAANGAARRDHSDTVDRLLKLGLRNRWYGIATSAEITDKPLGLTRLGEKIVVWRDADGQVRAVEDRCPHRGIALSIGEVHEGRLKCAYHGIEVDGDGVVKDVPALPGGVLLGQKLIRDYPVFEHYQMVWAYFGDAAHPEPPSLELPLELTSPDWSGVLHSADWIGHYQYVYDNLADPMHGAFLHGSTYMQSGGTQSDEMVVEDTGHGFEFFRAGQEGVSFDWMEFIDAGSSNFVRAKIAFSPAGGPGGPLCIVFYPTPIDENNTRIFAYRFRQVSGWQADLYHFMYQARFRRHMDAVLAQDEMALAAMPPWPPQENLYEHDMGLVRVRRHFEKMAEDQARELLATSTG